MNSKELAEIEKLIEKTKKELEKIIAKDDQAYFT